MIIECKHCGNKIPITYGHLSLDTYKISEHLYVIIKCPGCGMLNDAYLLEGS